ncbi:uncharacterized protein UDID_19215 [Ustilago sp. UG-2017a]|nr:uncharacterized protein UDID_19215 [Ustilago sp. UG-2017a]
MERGREDKDKERATSIDDFGWHHRLLTTSNWTLDPGKDRIVHCLGSLAIERKTNASEPNLSAVVHPTDPSHRIAPRIKLLGSRFPVLDSFSNVRLVDPDRGEGRSLHGRKPRSVVELENREDITFIQIKLSLP